MKKKIKTLLRSKYDALKILLFGGWNFHLGTQKKLLKVLIKAHYQAPSSLNNVSRVVVYMCNGWAYAGGMADRFKGIISMYDYCKKTNQQFKINYTDPFPLTDYLTPNNYNWFIADNDISYSLNDTSPLCFIMEPKPFRSSKMQRKLPILKELWFRENIVLNNKQIHIYTNTFVRTDSFGEMFHQLFKPSSRLQQSLDSLKGTIGESYIAIVFRFQQLLGDFQEGCYPILDESKRKELIEKCKSKMLEIGRDKKVLVTSDSRSFLDEVSKDDNIFVIPGKVVHIDYTKDASYEVYEKSFLDFFMIAGANHVYQLRTGQMYRSGFPEVAAMINNKPYDLIEF